MIRRDGTMALFALLALAGFIARASAEEVVEIDTRPPWRIRALLEKPDHPVGSVILLAGGHGNLALGANGRIGWGEKNQLVRSREQYGQAGLVTLVPDIAPDLKQGGGVRPRYRWSQNHARDIGALVKYLRAIAPPVVVVGTSRAALSVANAAVRLSGAQRPDALVITSGMLMHVVDDQPSVERMIGGLAQITQPLLLVSHANDACVLTQARSARRLKLWLPRAARVDSVVLRGGPQGSGDPCEAFSHHGFFGQDDAVVAAIASWIKRLQLLGPS
jgi:hypothetical protein